MLPNLQADRVFDLVYSAECVFQSVFSNVIKTHHVYMIFYWNDDL